MSFENIEPVHINNKFNTIYLSYYENNEKKYSVIENFRNYFYFSDYDKPIISKEFVKKQSGSFNNKNAANFDNTYEADLSLSKRFLLDTFGKRPSLKKIALRGAILDIECLIEGKITTNGKFPISAISVYDTETKQCYTFGYNKNVGNTIDKINKIRIYDDEKKMLDDFLSFMLQGKFDYITGWNVYNFDITYLANRLEKFNILNDLSPFGIVDKWISKRTNEVVVNIIGLPVIDYLDLFKKYHSDTLNSYSLQNVCEIVLGHGKIQFDGNLNSLYLNDYNTYIHYNRHDVLLIQELEEKCSYFALTDEIRRLSICKLDESTEVSHVIDNLLIRILNNSGFVVATKHFNFDAHYVGAYVKEPRPGIYKNVVCNDFASLYPNIIMNYNISPDTFMKKIPEDIVNTYDYTEDEIVAFNGAIFKKKTKGIFAKLLIKLYEKRKYYKKLKVDATGTDKEKYYKVMDDAYKRILNSFYGYLGFSDSRFFDINLAEAVTITGQKLIKHAISILEENDYICITSDTDSIYFTNSSIKNTDDAKKLGIEVQNEIQQKLIQLCKTKSNIDDANFVFEYEKTAKKAIFFKKKHYILHLVDKDHHEVDMIHYTGVSVKKSDTPDFVKKYLKMIYESILKTDDYFEIVNKYIKEFNDNLYSAEVEDIGLPVSLTKKLSEYTKNLPMHVRGALYWEMKYAEKFNISFDNINKGKMYCITKYINESDAKHFGNKPPVICIPEDIKFPIGLEIDYDRMKERLIDKQLTNLLEIIDYEKANIELEKEYKDKSKEFIITNIYNSLFNELVNVEYLHKLDKPMYYNRLSKMINDSYYNKLFNLKFNEDVSEFIIEMINNEPTVYLIIEKIENDESVIYESGSIDDRDAEYRKYNKQYKEKLRFKLANVKLKKDKRKKLEKK